MNTGWGKVVPPLFFVLAAVATLLVIPQQISTRITTAVNARFFPLVVTFAIIAFGTLDFVIQLWKARKSEAPVGSVVPSAPLQSGSEENRSANYLGVLLTMVLLAGWIWLTPRVGYIVSSLVLVSAAMAISGNRRKFQLVAFPVAAVLLLYTVFVVLLGIRFT